jgi:hypothetical protein
MYSGAGGVQRELSYRNAHPVRTKVTKPEDSLSVRHDDSPDRSVRPIPQDFSNTSPILGTDEQTLRTSPQVPVPLACEADSGGVNDWQHLLEMIQDDAVEEDLVPIVKRGQVQVLVDVRFVAVKVFEDFLCLLLLREHARGQQSPQTELVSFGLRERRSLVESRVMQKVNASWAFD